MSTIQQKIVREQRKQSFWDSLGVTRVITNEEKCFLRQRLNYPQIYGRLPSKIVTALAKIGIIKRK